MYYESHITMAPFEPERYKELQSLCFLYGFGTADLTKKDTCTICTAKGRELGLLEKDTLDLVKALKVQDFKVTRYKIEQVVLDVRL